MNECNANDFKKPEWPDRVFAQSLLPEARSTASDLESLGMHTASQVILELVYVIETIFNGQE